MKTKITYKSAGSLKFCSIPPLCSFLLLFGSQTPGEEHIEIITIIPVIKVIQLLPRCGLGLASDLELKTMREVRL
jgi:hypothetical protein